VRDFVRTHKVAVALFPHLEASDAHVRRRREYFGAYMLFVLTIVEHDAGIVLIQQHYGEDLDGGVWKLPGGGVERDEEITAAAGREVQEETGLAVEITGPVGVFRTGRRAPAEGTIDAFVVVLAGRATSGDLGPGDATEIARVGVFTFDEIEALIAAGTFGSGTNPHFRAGEIEMIRRWAAGRRAGR
jgi:ADP-ribose pyrophosphatase YjhB (NUDIX family)